MSTDVVVNLAEIHSPDAELRRRAIAGIGDSLSTRGYVTISHHGIDKLAFNDVYTAIDELFALPTDVKRRYADPKLYGMAGYIYGDPNEQYGTTRVPTEMWHIQRELPPGTRTDDAIPANPWPKELPSFRPAVLRLFAQMDACGMTMLRALALYLGEAEDRLAGLCENGWALQRLMLYPPPLPNMPANTFRASAHADMCFLTLYTGGTVEGLEIQQPDGEWHQVQAGVDEFLIGAGDMMKHITNGYIKPAMHRVRYSTTNVGYRKATPFFLLPRPEADLTPLASCVARTGGAAKFPSATAARVLAARTGWTNDVAAKEHVNPDRPQVRR
jgi:isopenicillin N synthase-like dioxygenase